MADSPVTTLRDHVEAAIGNAGPAILTQVQDHFVSAETNRRSDLIVQSVVRLRQLEVDLSKVKRGDVETFNEDGSPATTAFTKGRLAEIKKAREAVERLSNAVNKAIQDNSPDSFKKLEEVLKKGGKPDAAEKSEE